MSLSKLVRTLTTALIVAVLWPMTVAFSQDSADSVVTITKEESVQISNIDDWDFGTWAVHDIANIAVRLQDDTCVFSSTGSYSLTIDSQNSVNRLRLSSADGETIRYIVDVSYSDGSGVVTERVRNTGTTITNMTGSLALGCTDSGNSNLQFTPIVSRNQFNRASPGIYQDVVTLLVTPE